MKKTLFVILFMISPARAEVEQYSSYLLLDSFSYSKPMAVKAVADDEWNEDFSSGDIAFSTDRIEAGFGWNDWRLGAFRRYDFFYQFSPDTAYLKYATENGVALTPGQQLDIYLEANTLIANGLSLSFSHATSSANFSVRASYLSAKELTAGSLRGNATTIAENDYNLMFDVDYYYSEDALFDRNVARPDGNGFALDIFVDWHYKQWSFDLAAQDILSRIFWQDAPRTIATGSTDTRTYDDNGFVVFNPVASGIETNQDYTQTLPRKIFFQSAYEVSDHALVFEFRDYELKQFYSLGAQTSLAPDEQISLLYNLSAHALTFSYNSSYLAFSLTSDDLRVDQARTFGLTLSSAYNF